MVERWVYLGNPSAQLIVRLATGEAIQVLIQNSGDEVPYSQGTPVTIHLPSEALPARCRIPASATSRRRMRRRQPSWPRARRSNRPFPSSRRKAGIQGPPVLLVALDSAFAE